MVDILYYLAAILMLTGAVFSLLAAVGLLRLPDLYTRLHAASKAGIVGAGLVLVAVGFVAFDSAVIFRVVAGILFLLLTTPISAHLLARAALLSGLRPNAITNVNDIEPETKTNG